MPLCYPLHDESVALPSFPDQTPDTDIELDAREKNQIWTSLLCCCSHQIPKRQAFQIFL